MTQENQMAKQNRQQRLTMDNKKHYKLIDIIGFHEKWEQQKLSPEGHFVGSSQSRI